MNRRATISAFNVLATLILPLVFISYVFAHGDEDHGVSKPTTSNVKGTVIHTARVRHLEITLKHPLLEPDARTPARLFVTLYETNEPVGEDRPLVEIMAADGKTYQVGEINSNTPGTYSFELPPLPEGDYKILIRLSNATGKSIMATFENITVAHSHDYMPTNVGSWAQTALIILGTIIIVGSFGVGIWFAIFRLNNNLKEASEVRSGVVSR